MPTFNPQTGEWEGLEPPRLPRNNSTPTYTRRDNGASVIDMSNGGGFARRPSRPSLFSRLNNCVSSIGNWIADFADNGRSIVNTILCWLLWAAGAIGLIAMAFNGHWIMAIIIGLIAGSIYYYFSMLIALIASWLVFLPIACLRFIFYNIWTLIIALLIVVAACVGNNSTDLWHNAGNAVEEVAVPAVSHYTCDAWVLNIRDRADKSGNVIGVYQKGDEVLVTDLYAGDEFVAVDFNGQQGFVSRKYITPND